MTNLMRWLFYLGIFAIPYCAIVFQLIELDFLRNWKLEFLMLPVVLVILFGLYAAGTVFYRVFTFNDCPEAEKELQKQILDARKDLISKGFKFRD